MTSHDSDTATERPRRTVADTNKSATPERQVARAEGSRMLARAMLHAGVSQTMLAHVLGCGRTRVQQYLDEEEWVGLPMADLLVFSERLPTLFAELLGELTGYADQDEPVHLSFDRHLRRMADALGSAARLLDEHDVDPGSLDAELGRLERAASAARRDLRSRKR